MKEVLRAAGHPVRPPPAGDRRRTRRSRSPRPSASRSSPSRPPGPARRRPTGSTTPTPCAAGSRPSRRGPRRRRCSRSSSSARSTRSTASRSAARRCGRRSSDYLPPPLEVLRNPWIQWTVLLPREHRRPALRRRSARSDRPRSGRSACATGSRTWSGSGARTARWRCPRSAARPPGAQLIVDARLRARRRLLPDVGRAGAARPVRPARSASTRPGAAYLRGQGQGSGPGRARRRGAAAPPRAPGRRGPAARSPASRRRRTTRARAT